MTDKRSLVFTTVGIILVGIVTGLFLGGGLLPSQAAPQQYDEKTATSKTELSIIHAHDGISQHEHLVTIVTTTTETTPHGTFHNFAAAMTQGTTTASTASGPKQAANEVWIWAREFRPNTLTVPVGTKVTWINKEGEDHTITSSKAGLFDASVGPFGSWSFTFTDPGSYEYYCGPHSAMTGVINVK